VRRPSLQDIVIMAENWHQERDRLVHLLRAIEMGEVTHIDETDLRQLQATNPDNVASLKQRLAMLNSRLGEN
jgi:hypothetical protein